MQGEFEITVEANEFDRIADQVADVQGLIYSLQTLLEEPSQQKAHLLNLVPAVIQATTKRLDKIRQDLGSLAEIRRTAGRKRAAMLLEEEHHG